MAFRALDSNVNRCFNRKGICSWKSRRVIKETSPRAINSYKDLIKMMRFSRNIAQLGLTHFYQCFLRDVEFLHKFLIMSDANKFIPNSCLFMLWKRNLRSRGKCHEITCFAQIFEATSAERCCSRDSCRTAPTEIVLFEKKLNTKNFHDCKLQREDALHHSLSFFVRKSKCL